MKKFITFIKIYGFLRTLVKVAGRTDYLFLKYFFKAFYFRKNKYVSLIGCGQFGFSTISYFVQKRNCNIFLDCYDLNENKSKKCSSFWGYSQSHNVNKLFDNKKCDLLYIASDHYSHTDYALQALKRNIHIYIEKPICVNFIQYKRLIKAIESSNSKVFAGYNRPFSKAILFLSKKIENKDNPISLSCFISGHFIEQNHWYRNPEEGTRICGNMGHWIDLGIHLLNKKGDLPNIFIANINYADKDEPDDNLCVTLSTNNNDIISFFLTSRTEPFEGINETINFQCGDIIAKIDDFRKMTVWQNAQKITKRYWPKDVGHKNAILQPFKGYFRDFNEIKISTLIMLIIKDMVISKENIREINVIAELNKIFVK